MENFYVLNGDHRSEYHSIIDEGFDKCMDYFKENIHKINKYSERPEQ